MKILLKSDIELFRNGDEAIFEKIVETFYPPMRNFSRQFTNDLSADDITIQALSGLFNARGTIDSLDSIRAFLYKAIFEHLNTRNRGELHGTNGVSLPHKGFIHEIIRFECLLMKSTHVKNLLTARK